VQPPVGVELPGRRGGAGASMQRRLLTWAQDRNRWSAVMLSVLVLGMAWIWLSAIPAEDVTAGRIPAPREGFAAPDFSASLLRGGEIRLSDLRGEAVVINLWASWCPPCRTEMPALQQSFAANADRGLAVLAVNMTYQDSLSEANRFADEYGLSFNIPLDRDGEIARLYQLRALPTTFFVDPEGLIRRVVVGGPISAANLQAGIEELLREER
jgi:cytochrome c biogenesis protein CcmG/thiol:disulfide interchange protein DsbE